MIGVSRDRQETSDRFRDSLKLPYPLVGDPDGTITRAYKVGWPIVGLARRVTFLVGSDLRIQMVFPSELDPTAHADRVAAFLPARP